MARHHNGKGLFGFSTELGGVVLLFLSFGVLFMASKQQSTKVVVGLLNRQDMPFHPQPHLISACKESMSMLDYCCINQHDYQETNKMAGALPRHGQLDNIGVHLHVSPTRGRRCYAL